MSASAACELRLPLSAHRRYRRERLHDHYQLQLDLQQRNDRQYFRRQIARLDRRPWSRVVGPGQLRGAPCGTLLVMRDAQEYCIASIRNFLFLDLQKTLHERRQWPGRENSAPLV